MPNRVVREGILDSDRVNKLSWAGEVFYRRLMSVVDDFGRFDGRVDVLRSKLFPLRIDKVSIADTEKWLTECVGAGLVSTYFVNQKPYLELLDFGQSIRIKKSKFPAPCEQMNSNASMCTSESNSIQSETESNPKPNPKSADADENFRNKFLEIKTKILKDEMFRGDAGKMYLDDSMYLKAVDEFFIRKINTKEFIADKLTEESNCRRNLMFWLSKNYSRIEKEFKNGNHNGKAGKSDHGKIEVVISD